MSKRTTRLGKTSQREAVFIFGIGAIFVHGVISSLLLKVTDCFQVARIVDLLLIVILLLAATLWPLRLKFLRIRDNLISSRLLQMFGTILLTYTFWILGSGLLQKASMRETLLALLFDTVLFWTIYVIALAQPFTPTESQRIIRKTVLVVAVLSGIAGALYILGLHDNIDQWLGFGQCNSQAVLRTGGADSWLRSRGFVRNPNELGALLVIPTALAFTFLLRHSKNAKKTASIWLVAFGTLLVFTFSRSAWLAMSASLGLMMLIQKQVRHYLLKPKILISMCIVLLCGVLILSQNTKLVDQLIFHQSEQGSSTEKHWQFKQQGISYIADNPLGTGPGSAGAIGTNLKDGPAIETESAHLDIGAQYGLVGIALWLALFTSVWRLYRGNKTAEAVAILAGFSGLAFGGIFIPVWSNLTVTLFAGIMLGLGYTSLKRTKKPSR